MKIINILLIINIMNLIKSINCIFFFNKIPSQTLILNKSKKNIELIKNSNVSINNFISNNISDKRIIRIAPDGIKGFYDFGTCLYIKKNYNLNNFIFSGVSSGSWNALFLTFNKDINRLVRILIKEDFKKIGTLENIQQHLKRKILLNYNDNDFDLKKLYICVIQIDKYTYKNIIYSDFINLEDALNCCIASSNIPLFTGKFVYKYQNKLSYDGIFLQHPYLYLNNSFITIDKCMYNNYLKKNIVRSQNIFNITRKGYRDSKKNKNKLDKYFYDDKNLF